MTRADIFLGAQLIPEPSSEVDGKLVDFQGERFYRIGNVQRMPPFFMSLVSDADHWLFVGSNGGLTAGRRNPSLALFPYVTEDKIIDSAGTTGPFTSLVVRRGDKDHLWQPFRDSALLAYRVTRNVYKNILGNRLVFEEVNLDLECAFRYEWRTSQRFGFVRDATLTNLGASNATVRVLDGLLNLLPSDVDEAIQLGFSCLLDAYKKNELFQGTPLAVYTLAAQVVDRAEARESLHATSVWSYGLSGAAPLLSSRQVERFERGLNLEPELEIRGQRGAYLMSGKLELNSNANASWRIVADVRQNQADVSSLLAALAQPEQLNAAVDKDLERAHLDLRRIIAATDALELTADEASCAHHVQNVLFNDMRGGVYAFGYSIPSKDFAAFVAQANRAVSDRHAEFLKSLPESLPRKELAALLAEKNDSDLERLGYEYLPLTFSRRHGDPSRPWNRFDIRLTDANGNKLLNYQGNWRDIFQNWEALSFSYPDFVENIIVKFLCASTADGYNPYRITRAGIDWEVPEPDHPWASIGYWGDHQIIYLLKLLELSKAHHPERLTSLLQREMFSYANVPYEIKAYTEIVKDPRNTIVFNRDKHKNIMALTDAIGADGKLLFSNAQVYRASMLEKLLVTSLAKMTNFVPQGGIWLNTQRPEWNDANNALVGYGLSMVTLAYLERFFAFTLELLEPFNDTTFSVSKEVAELLTKTQSALDAHRHMLSTEKVSENSRLSLMAALGNAGSDYRTNLYANGLSGKTPLAGRAVRTFIETSLEYLRHTLASARRDDGLFQSYNLLAFTTRGAAVEPLYEMLEGQVAALSARCVQGSDAAAVLESLATSRMYRADQNSFTLYPDRKLPGFLEKNTISEEDAAESRVLLQMLEQKDGRIVFRDALGKLRFNADFYNADPCREALLKIQAAAEYSTLDEAEIERILALYEKVFHHHAFTGRSGSMFGYEGLGSIYWHMVAKLLLATQEQFFRAHAEQAPQALRDTFARRYYEIRNGVGGFNKTPANYGAFPLDPYSHTPAHSGARQPGMTGQVKEEVITRLGELGVRVQNGCIAFRPLLLRNSEFLGQTAHFKVLAADGSTPAITLEPGTLAFTYCQVPIVYHRSTERRIAVTHRAQGTLNIEGDSLPPTLSREVFERSSDVQRIDVWTEGGL
jgi:hypothetical protein